MITVYDAFEKDFRHNGLGVLDMHIQDDVVSWQDNGLFSFSFTYPSNAFHSKHLKGDNIVKTPTPFGEQLFRIRKPKNDNGIFHVEALHISYDLANNLIEDTFVVNKNGKDALSQILTKTQYKHPFTFSSDIKTTASSRIVRKNPIEILIDGSLDNSFVNRWGGHIYRDNFRIEMKSKLSTNKPVILHDKKNVKGYVSDAEYGAVTTRIMPKAFDGLLLPEKYVDSPLLKAYPFPKISIVEFSDIKAEKKGEVNQEGTVPLKVAHDMMRKRSKECYSMSNYDKPQVTYDIDFIDLRNTDEYNEFRELEKIEPGSLVTFIHEEENHSFEITANMNAFTYNSSSDSYLTMSLGNYKPTFTNIMNRVDDVNDSIPVISDVLAKNQADLIRGAHGGSIITLNPSDLGLSESKNPFMQVFMNGDNLRDSDEFLALSKNGLGFIEGPFNIDNFKQSWGLDGVLNLAEGKLQLGSKALGKFLTNTADGLEFSNLKTVIGTMGTAGKNFPGFSQDDTSKKALSIEILDGEFFKVQTSGESNDVTGLFIPNPRKFKDTGNDLIIANTGKKNGITIAAGSQGFNISGSDVTLISKDGKFDIKSPKGLFLNGEQIFPGQGSGGGGGSWNGQYPPELTTSGEKFAWQLYQILLSKGYSKQAACGILGNVQGEVGIGMNPDTEQGGGPAYGCVQWDGSAFPLRGPKTWNGREYVQTLMDAANIKGDYRTMATQGPLIDWCMYSGQWIGQVNPSTVSGFKTVTSASQAAYAFEMNFERPRDPHPERQGWAENWYNKFKDLKQPVGGGYVSPMNKPIIVTSEFGWRTGPLGGGQEFHNGIDIVNNTDTRIFASGPGEVIQASGEYFSWYGNWVVIRHADGLNTGYAHLSSISVKRGDTVTQGQLLGYQGATGPVTGPHLHFQFMKKFLVHDNDNFINPRQYVKF